MTTVTDALARSLPNGLEGRVLLPGDAGYDEARQVWNAMVDRRPRARPRDRRALRRAQRAAA